MKVRSVVAVNRITGKSSPGGVQKRASIIYLSAFRVPYKLFLGKIFYPTNMRFMWKRTADFFLNFL